MAKQEIFLKDYTVPEYLIDTIDLTFVLKDGEKSSVQAVYKVRKNPESTAENNFILNADEIEVTEIRLNDNILSDKEYQFDGKTFILKNAPEEFTFQVNNLIDPENNSHLMGVYKSKGMFCSQCEPEGFRRITLHPDRPDVMSEFTVTIIANKKNYPILLSNGNLVAEENLEEGLHMAKWHDPFKKPGHLFAVVAGDLDYIADTFTTMTRKKVDLKVYTDKKNINKAGFAMHSLKKAMAWDEETYGREYDLENFKIVAVDAFNMGAMENKGLNIFNSDCVLSSPRTTTDFMLEWIQGVVGHEYFHNWSGNRVGCRDWFQLSLKEGFTVFRDIQFSTDMTQGIRKRIDDAAFIKSQQFAEDSSPMSHPVQPQSYQEIDNFYTFTVYDKGAEVVRMYQTLLGKKAFREGAIKYFDKHDGQAATIEDFRASMEQAGGVDLSLFARWYTQEGTPTLQVEEHYNEKSQTLTLSFKQVLKEGQDPFFIPVKYGLVDKNGNDINTMDLLIVREMDQSFEFYDLAEKPTVSLLREFSAPVKLEHSQTDEEILFLAKNDNDLYNRYQAIQRILIEQAKQSIEDIQAGKNVSVSKDVLELFKHTLNDETIDLAVLKNYLSLPTETTLGELISPIDPIAMKEALKNIQQIIATELEEDFKALFDKYHKPSKHFEFTAEEINRRAIILHCLEFLAKADEEKYSDLIHDIFENSDNMTLEHGAFKILVDFDNKVVIENALEEFYTRWKDDNLVINYWLKEATQNEVLCDVEYFKKMQKHEIFNIKEPNKIRGLAGGFIENKNFHTKEGYKAFADLVIEVDKINPHISATLTKKIMSYKKYAQPYADLMLESLKYINENVTTAGIKEILSKTLGK